MIDFERLDQIKARAKAATAGPWKRESVPRSKPRRGFEQHEYNFDFVTNAREDVPWLIEQLEFYVANCDVLLKLIMTKTDLCPFGGSESGKREDGCRFGYPGCACMDWLMAHEDEVEEKE